VTRAVGNIYVTRRSKGWMGKAIVIASVVALALSGCGGGGEKATSEPQQGTTREASTVALCCPLTPTERVLRAIRACEVKRIFFTAGDLTYVTYDDGRKFRSKRLDRKALGDAASPYGPREDDCHITIEIE
jgi:hypothetical protein